jgi:hypothetical protein
LKGVEYRFNIEPNSTTKQNKEKSLMSLKDLMTTVASLKDVITNDPRIEVDWPLMMKSFEQFSDIKGASGFIKMKPGPSPQEQALQQQLQDLQQQLQDAQMKASQDKPKTLGESMRWTPPELTPNERAQALQQVGITPDPAGPPPAVTEPTPPTVNANGMMFHDPSIAKAAEVMSKPSPSPEASQPIVSDTGHMFNDPAIAKVASAISKS